MRKTTFSRLSLCAAIGALAIAATVTSRSLAAEDAVKIPVPAVDVQSSDGLQTAVVAGGCFWGMQDLLRRYPGIVLRFWPAAASGACRAFSSTQRGS